MQTTPSFELNTVFDGISLEDSWLLYVASEYVIIVVIVVVILCIFQKNATLEIVRKSESYILTIYALFTFTIQYQQHYCYVWEKIYAVITKHFGDICMIH
jgi:hypothetical protein